MYGIGMVLGPEGGGGGGGGGGGDGDGDARGRREGGRGGSRFGGYDNMHSQEQRGERERERYTVAVEEREWNGMGGCAGSGGKDTIQSRIRGDPVASGTRGEGGGEGEAI